MKNSELINNDRSNQLERAVEYILKHHTYGDEIEYEELFRILGVEEDPYMFSVLMARVKYMLVEYGYVLKSVINVGYRILYPQEATNMVFNSYAKSSLKKLGNGIRILQHVDTSLLNESDKERLETLYATLNKMYISNENSLIETGALINITKRKELGGDKNAD